MTLTMNIGFEPSEFENAEKVLCILINENWIVADTREFAIIRPNKPRKVTRKEYTLKREIT